MQNMDCLLDLVTAKYSSMSQTNRKIAQFVLDYPHKMVQMDLTEFAEATKTSRSSVIRFCKTLGLSGYRELQQKYLEQQPLFTKEHGNLEWCFEASQAAILQTFRAIDLIEFQEVVQRLANANQIIWYGLGESGFQAEIANHKCRYLGINSYSCQDESSFIGISSFMKDSDVLILISQSGEGHYFRRPLEIAKALGVYTVVITSKPVSWLAQRADVCLFAYSRAAIHQNWLAVIKAGFEAITSTLILQIAEQRGTELTYEGDER